MLKKIYKKLLSPSLKMVINYPPDIKPRYGGGQPYAKNILALFESKQGVQLEFLSLMSQYKGQLSSIPINADADSITPCWNQPWFPPLDGMSMYTIIADSKPRRYVEVGSGNSTKFAVRAISDMSPHEVEVISVDPQPRSEIDGICGRIIRKPLEEADEFEDVLSMLEPNDVVFFDGSHRCLQNSDVTAFFIDYLPLIPDGVKVGIHDIFWPDDYPRQWVKRYYNEQYVLGAYMLGMGSRFPLIFSCAYMWRNYKSEISECLDSDLVSKLKQQGKSMGGGALWFEKYSL